MFQTTWPVDIVKRRVSECTNFPNVSDGKRSGEIKTRACANGSTQRTHIVKEEATAPTVTSEAIFLQGTIFAHENRDIDTGNIPGAFLQADNPDYVLMRLDGILAELMVQAAPSLYRKYFTSNVTGKPILYVQLEKAVCGLMESALLFYRKLVADLKSLGYEINLYDPCVANKTINGKQITISFLWDTKIQLLLPTFSDGLPTNMIQLIKSSISHVDIVRIILEWPLSFPPKQWLPSTWYHTSTKSLLNSLKISQGCLLHLQRIIYSLFVRPPKPNSSLKNKLVLSIIQWHNYYFILKFDMTSKLQLHS